MRVFTLFLLLFLNSSMLYSQISAEVLNDSALSIYKENPIKAISLLERALNQASSSNDSYQKNTANNYLGIVYRDLGEIEKSKSLSEQVIAVAVDSLLLASAYNNLGACHRQLGSYEAALSSYLKALSIYENKEDLVKQATVQNNIGMVYSYSGINDKAIDYHLRAKETFEALNDQKGISQVYNNIAIIYANDGNLEKALDYFKYSLQIEKILNDKKGIAESANNVGAVYYYMQEIDSALVYFKKSVAFEKSIGNATGVGASYNNIANVLIEADRVIDSKIYIDSAYYFAKEAKVTTDIESALLTYSAYYEARNDNKLALKFFKDYSVFKDSILNIETNSKIAELEIEYETEKKEKEILTQRADLAEKELDLNKKNSYIFGLIALAVVLILLGYLIYNQQKLKNRQLQKENELKDALVKIETQNHLQEQRLRISRDLHDNIGAQLTFIISSIDNLKFGFKLPEKLGEKLKTISAFTTTTIYELRDTIWAMNKSEITFEDLQSRISNFMDKAEHVSEDIAFRFEVDSKVKTDVAFSSMVGMNLYRIIQESVNNALKYANATEIIVSISQKSSQLQIVITDNGNGFNISTTELGNGIRNIRKRSHDISAEFSITSELGTGTNIRVILNV